MGNWTQLENREQGEIYNYVKPDTAIDLSRARSKV